MKRINTQSLARSGRSSEKSENYICLTLCNAELAISIGEVNGCAYLNSPADTKPLQRPSRTNRSKQGFLSMFQVADFAGVSESPKSTKASLDLHLRVLSA